MSLPSFKAYEAEHMSHPDWCDCWGCLYLNGDVDLPDEDVCAGSPDLQQLAHATAGHSHACTCDTCAVVEEDT